MCLEVRNTNRYFPCLNHFYKIKLSDTQFSILFKKMQLKLEIERNLSNVSSQIDEVLSLVLDGTEYTLAQVKSINPDTKELIIEVPTNAPL